MLGLFLVAALPLAGCGSKDNGESTPTVKTNDPEFFKDITDKVGLDFVHDAGPMDRTFFLPQICGSGGAVFDFDGDGLMDLYLVHCGGDTSKSKNRLYKQMKDGTFKDVSAGSGLDISGLYFTGVAVGDVNNDGLPDVLVSHYSGIKLFINLGGGKFKDVTEEAGLHDPFWATSAAFFDYNRDGYLDLFVCNYVDYQPRFCDEAGGKRDYCSPKNFKGTPSKLFRNLGKKATERGKAVLFEDISISSRIATKGGPGFGVVVSDFTGDGYPDILVANDGAANHLWVYDPKTGKYTEEAVLRNVAYNNIGQQCANMGVAWGDFTNEGLCSLFITHLPDENNTLWRQIRPGQFQDMTAAHGLANPVWRGAAWGVTFQDFDNDGWLDLAIVNGRVASRGNFRGDKWDDFVEHYGDRNQVFMNMGKVEGKEVQFKDISLGSKDFSERLGVFRGLMWADLDNDGAVDLIATEINGRARIFKNVAPKRGNWLMIRCVEPALGGRDAYGAVLTIRAGDKQWRREVIPSLSYQTSSDPRVHVGVGNAQKVDTINVVWADGQRETFANFDVNNHVTLRRGEGTAATEKSVK
jgi:hypothetical protein